MELARIAPQVLWVHADLQSFLPALSLLTSSRTSNPWMLIIVVLGTVLVISPRRLPPKSARSVTITISIERLMSLRLKNVSIRSISLPVETRTAVSKFSRRILQTAASPPATFVTTHPAKARHFSTASQISEQTSNVLSNRRSTLRPTRKACRSVTRGLLCGKTWTDPKTLSDLHLVRSNSPGRASVRLERQ